MRVKRRTTARMGEEIWAIMVEPKIVRSQGQGRMRRGVPGVSTQ